MSDMNESDMKKAVRSLMMSETVRGLIHLTKNVPVDVNNPDDLKMALSTTGFEVIKALDKNRIKFKRKKDEAMLNGLLMVTMDIVLGGKLASFAEEASIN